MGLIPGLGRSPGEGKGYPLQYSGLENSMNCIVHRVTKSWTRLSDFHSHHRGLECKSRKSRDTWSNKLVWSTNEEGQRLTELCQENSLVIANTLFQQHKRGLYTWTSPDGQHRNQIDYILCSQRWRSSIQSAKTRLGADYGSDHEFLIAKFRLKSKKVGETTRPFRYDLN